MEFSIPMALFDFVPIVLFVLGAVRIGTDLFGKMSMASKMTYISGTSMTAAAGFFKALYKLLYAAAELDIPWMNSQFFPNQALGFMLAGIGLMMTLRRKNEVRTCSVLPTGLLVGMVVIGMAAMYAALCKHAADLKKISAIVTLVISFFLSLCMGYLSSRSFETAAMNWLAQSVNACAMLLFFISSMMLHNAGLGRTENK